MVNAGNAVLLVKNTRFFRVSGALKLMLLRSAPPEGGLKLRSGDAHLMVVMFWSAAG